MPKIIKKNNNDSSKKSNSSLTLDDILGTFMYSSDRHSDRHSDTHVKDSVSTGSISNTAVTTSTTNTTSNNTAISDITITKNKTDTITSDTNSSIDYILNNNIVKFDNKLQTSMYFVDYKSITIFSNILKTKFNINIPKEIIDSHIINQIPEIIKEYTCNLKKRCKKNINVEYICLGRKIDTKQCTRKKHNGSDFCKSHLIKLSNGRIDEPIQTVVRCKRGRKRKVEFDPRQYDNEYITLWEDIIDGQKILLDGNNNMYTYDLQAPQYIGKKYIDTKIDLSKYNTTKTKTKTVIEEVKEVLPLINDINPIIVEELVKPIVKKKINFNKK